MATQDAAQDKNFFPALIAHTGTAGTAETVRLVADSAGALTTVGGAAGGSNVNIVTGTQQRLGTVGTLENLNAGTITSIGNVVGGTTTVANRAYLLVYNPIADAAFTTGPHYLLVSSTTS